MAMTPELEKIHKQALEDFDAIENRERDQRALALEDAYFINAEDGQWDDDAKEKRNNRPRYTIDRTSPAVDQIVGDQRQNRTSIKINPVSGGADDDGAKLLGGLIRNIESQSKAENAYGNGFTEKTTGGFGGWRVLTKADDDADPFSNIQDILIKPILSAATSLFFGRAEEYDKRDASHAFLITNSDRKEFVRENPGISVTDFSQSIYATGPCSTWFKDENIRVAEYWVKTPITRNMALLSDGRVIDKDEEKDVIDEIKAKGVTIEKEATVKSHKVQMYKMNGAEIYDGPFEWAGKFIPLIPDYGRVVVIEDKEFVRGVVRKAKDPARIYNYATSNAIETNALTPKDPYWYTPKMAEGFKPEYQNFNTKNSPFMPFNHDSDEPGPPRRSGAPSVQTALLETVRQAENDLYLVTGMGPPALGLNPGMQSGVALKRQDEKGDRGSFIFQDNHSKSIQYTGDILADLIPRIYDTNRVVTILNLDGKSETVEINQQALNDFNEQIIDEQTGEQVIVNDLSKGKYEASVVTGPAQATQREESASQLIELATASPRFEAISTDLIAKNLNVLESEELTERIRKGMIRDGIIEPTEEEIEKFKLNEPTPPDPQQTAITDNINMETEKSMSEIELNDAKRQQILIDNQAETIKSYETLMKSYKAQQEAGIPLGVDEHEIRKDTQATIEIATDDAIPQELPPLNQ